MVSYTLPVHYIYLKIVSKLQADKTSQQPDLKYFKVGLALPLVLMSYNARNGSTLQARASFSASNQVNQRFALLSARQQIALFEVGKFCRRQKVSTISYSNIITILVKTSQLNAEMCLSSIRFQLSENFGKIICGLTATI